MFRSMTGFSVSRFRISGHSFHMELKSYNHRGLEVHTRLPETMSELEPRLRSAVSNAVNRGKIFLSVRESVSDEPVYRVNEAFIQAGREVLSRLEKSLSSDKLDPSFLLMRPEIFTQGLPALDPGSEETILKNLERTIRAYDKFRLREGKRHEQEIKKSIKIISKAFSEIKKAAPSVKREKRRKLEEAHAELISDGPHSERLSQEIVILLDRIDFSEELIRFGEHLSFFNKAMNDEPCGKKLNFISQELLREANTLGVKSADFSVSRNVVLIKTELEKIKEQILNIE